MKLRLTWVMISVFLIQLVSGQTDDQKESLDGLDELTKDISPKARNAINELIAVDQASTSLERATGLKKVMENLDSETIKELFELYEKTTGEYPDYEEKLL